MAEEKDIKFFTQIPAWVDELDNISDFQARLIGYIYTFENVTGSAFPSNKHIAKRFGKSTRGVQNALSDLYQKGIITRTVVYREGTKEVERRYLHVAEPHASKVREVYTESAGGDTPKLREGIHPKCLDNKSINRSMNRLDNNMSISDDFEKVWALYPKKAGKTNAKKAFTKAIKDGVSVELIKSKIEEYNQQIEFKKTDRQYIKNGSTWFNQKAWEDEYETGTKKNVQVDYSGMSDLEIAQQWMGKDWVR